MSREFFLIEILDYYDGILLFAAKDSQEALFLSMLVERSLNGDKYLAFSIAQEQFESFRAGQIELLKLIEKSDRSKVFLLQSLDGLNDKYLGESFPDEIPPAWFPSEGYFCPIGMDNADAIFHEAKSQNKLISHISLDVPEAKDQPKIDISKLALWLGQFQDFLKFAYQKVFARNKEILEDIDAFCMQFCGYSRGSFTIHLQPKGDAKPDGSFPVEKALEVFDELVKNGDSQAEFLEVAKKYKGHVVRKYLKIAELVNKSNIEISYRLATPEEKFTSGKITKRQAGWNLEWFQGSEELSVEEITITGYLEKVDLLSGKWKLKEVSNRKTHRGVLKDPNRTSLRGVVLGSKAYRFFCEEKIEELCGFGKEKRTLLLVRFEDA